MVDYYINQMRTWTFTKDGDGKKWGIGGLRLRAERKLRALSKLEVGEGVNLGGTMYRRVDPNTPSDNRGKPRLNLLPTKEQYSSDYTFFLEHQILVVNTNRGYASFVSRLEPYEFLRIKTVEPLNGHDISVNCRNIHKSLEYYN